VDDWAQRKLAIIKRISPPFAIITLPIRSHKGPNIMLPVENPKKKIVSVN
jgi:hypothetical protein